MNPENNFEPNALDSNSTLGTFSGTPVGTPGVDNLGTPVSPVQPEVQPSTLNVATPATPVEPVAPVQSNIDIPSAPVESVAPNVQPATAPQPVAPEVPSSTGISAPGNSEIDLAEISSLVEDTLTNNYVAPTLTPDANQVPDVLGSTTPAAGANTNPTMPIPDTFPNVGGTSYQAEPLTQADYATPDSFDQIGSSPEINPKQKAKGNRKTITFLLLLLLVVALGAGSYYLINVKKIFNNKSVTTKTVSVEVGSVLSEDINDYATFKNITSTNCTQNFEDVDINVVGTYTYTIKCGSDEYKGTINVVDTTAPTASPKFMIAVKDSTDLTDLSALFTTCNETNCVFEGDTEDALKNALASTGLKILSVSIKDASGNATVTKAPLLVIDAAGRYALSAKKSIAVEEGKKYTAEESVFTIYTDTFTSVTYRTYTFADPNDYLEFTSSNSSLDSLTIDGFTGTPFYNAENNKIVIISTNNNEMISGLYESDYNNQRNNGYNISVISGTDLNHIDI